MSNPTYYTAGEIFRQNLLLTSKGTPCKSMTQVTRIVNQHAKGMIKTKYGLEKVLTADQIAEFNKAQAAANSREYVPLTP